MNQKTSTEKSWPPAWLPAFAVLCVMFAWPFIGYGARPFTPLGAVEEIGD